MVTHIVMFTFKDENKQENIAKAKAQIEALVDTVPSLKQMEVGENFADEERAMDLVLVSTFDSKEELSAYAIHPEHLKVVAFIKSVAEYSKVVDYEVH